MTRGLRQRTRRAVLHPSCALPWLGSACHTAPAITPALADAVGGAPPAAAEVVVASSCHHAALAASHLLSLDQLFIVCGAAGFLVMLGAVTGQTSVLEQVAHRASRMRPRDLFLDPSRVSGQPPAAQLPPSVGGSLSGTTPEQLQAMMRLTAGNDAAQPGVVAVRNRALATAASYSVRIAIKENQPRVRQALEELSCGQPASSDPSSEPLPWPSSATAPGAPSLLTPVVADGAARARHQDLRVAAQLAQRQEQALRLLVARELRRVEAAGGGQPLAWGCMTAAQVDALERQLLQAVAEQAALEQAEVLLAVVEAAQQEQRAAHGGSMDEGGTGHRGGDIRGGW